LSCFRKFCAPANQSLDIYAKPNEIEREREREATRPRKTLYVSSALLPNTHTHTHTHILWNEHPMNQTIGLAKKKKK